MSLTTRWPWIRIGSTFDEGTGERPEAFLDDVYRYARARLRSREDAEDIACEVVQALPEVCRRGDLRAYMIGMARRKVADRLRKFRETSPLHEVVGASKFDDASDMGTMVGQVLALLGEDQREALTLKYVIGLSSAEMALVLKRRPEAVDSLLQRGRAAFVKQWEALSSEETIR